MNRSQEMLRYIAAGTRGIEVAPWFKPVVPLDGTRQVVVLDVFDRATLLTRAETDPNIDKAMIPQITEVDLVGSACEIAELVRGRFGPEARFDFVVSSHNLEHLPDPVRFLRGCDTLLNPGGILTMAVPDKRACFDFFRPLASTGEMLQAFHERRERPSFAQIFSQGAYHAALKNGNGLTGAFTIDENPDQISLRGDLVQQYSHWLQRAYTNDTRYYDTHCWIFTPSSLELILTELSLLDLIGLDLISVTKPFGCEFIVHLRKRLANPPAQSRLADRRELLLHQTCDELAYASRYARRLRAEASTPFRKLFMVHIPKTGGETVNHLMTELLGKEQVLDHAENTPGFLTMLEKLPPRIRYVSGHFRLPEVLAQVDRSKWFIFVNLRNPVRHLISHLQWMKALGAPESKVFREMHDRNIQEMAKRLWEIKLDDVERIHRFIHEEFDDAKQFFDNCQVRYLMDYLDRPVGYGDVVTALRALESFDYVGLTETLSETLAALTRAGGVSLRLDNIPHRNESLSHEVVNLDDPAIRDFYCEAVRWDAFLYTQATKQERAIRDNFLETMPR